MELEYLLDLSAERLLEYIINLDNIEIKKTILKDQKIRDKFLNEPASHYPFVWLVQRINDETVLSLLDRNFLIQLLSSEIRVDDKFNAIMTCGNKNVNIFLNDVLFFEYIANCQTNQIYLSSLDNHFAKAFTNYLLVKNLNKMNLIANFKDNVQSELLDDKMILKILSSGTDYSFISLLSSSALNKLCIDPVFNDIISNLSINEIDKIISSATLSMSLQSSIIIINKYLEIKDIDQYRFMVNKLLLSNSELYENITKKRNRMVDNFIDSIDLNTETLPMFSLEQNINSPDYETKHEYNKIAKLSNEERQAYLSHKSKNYVVQLLIDRYFEENAYNFYINLTEMINYLQEFKQELINPDNYELYRQIYKYNDYSLMELVELYKSMNNGKDYVGNFYDDYRLVKNNAYQEINLKSIKSEQINNSPSYVYNGVKVLELHGEPFFSIAHCSRGIDINNRNKTTSLSVIGDKHTGLFKESGSTLTVGFDEIPIDQVMHVYHSDSFTSKEYSSKRINEISSIDSLLEKTRGYNEILLKQKANGNVDDFSLDKKYIFPSYIISINEIRIEDYEVAKKYNLPILLFYEKDYHTAKSSLDFDDNNYAEEKNNKSLN